MENFVQLIHRAKTMKNNTKYSTLTIEEIIDLLKKEQLAVLVAFYDIRQKYNFEISFADENSPFRCEIMDEMLAISPSAMQKNDEFPAAFIFGKESIFFESYITHFELQKNLAENKTRLTSANINEQLILEIAEKQNIKTTIHDLRKIYEKQFEKYGKA